ncbi:hypothetical protein B9G55_20175 [Saccharibacillus sp. O16]|nr:hypothetical protein B9G55_20175 [Saccharibacillus sp. O16]
MNKDNDKGQERLQLVFDVGGVLAANLDDFWSRLAAEAQWDRAKLRARYRAEIGGGLWQGEVSESAFWRWIQEVCPGVGDEQAKALLRGVLVPLPARDRLVHWSKQADIHILSNHVSAWIMPLFEGMESILSSIVVSSDEGFKKPDLRLFERTAAQLHGAKVCFIDDKQENLDVAGRLGWSTLLADPEGRWMTELERRIAAQSASLEQEYRKSGEAQAQGN